MTKPKDQPIHISTDFGALNVALAAACMARGLLPEQGDAVFEKLKDQALPFTVGQAMRNMDRAINEVRSEPRTHREES